MNADFFEGSKEPYYQKKLFKLLWFSYSEIRKEKSESPYSRKFLSEEQKKRKGKDGSKAKLELEDYLRNQLVDRFNNYRAKCNLESFYFERGVDVTKDDFSIGNLDIKVIFPNNNGGFANGKYLAIECKRINKSSHGKREYVKNGLPRFICRKYYPETDYNIAWMLSFMESAKKEHIESSAEIVPSINKIFLDLYPKNIIHKIGEKSLRIDVNPNLDVYDSLIIRNDDTELTVYHIFLDYYDLIKD